MAQHSWSAPPGAHHWVCGRCGATIMAATAAAIAKHRQLALDEVLNAIASVCSQKKARPWQLQKSPVKGSAA
jgi:hypothetical protein